MQSLKKEFLETLANYQGILHKVNLVYFRNKTDREDNFQEIVYQLWKSFPKIKNKNSIGSWIYAVSINTSISRLKKDSKMKYTDKIPEIKENSDFMEDMSNNEEFRQLLNAIHQLDEISRSVMLLYLEEKSYDEIASILGITSSNVGIRITRAKKQLKQMLNSKNHGK